MKAIQLFCLCAAMVWGQGAGAAQWSLIHAGQLLAEPGADVLNEQTIIIRDGRIHSIQSGYVQAAAVETEPGAVITVYDLKDRFVLPGLIDSHVHLIQERNPAARLQTVELSDADRAIWAAANAKKTLLAGFTTVRDVGSGGGDAIFAVRDGITNGTIVGPRVFASGASISVTGGHGDGTQGYRDDVAGLLHSPGVCDGVPECRRAVREQVRRGADHIKLTATAGVLSNTAAGLEQQFFEDELEAIMETAHLMGRKVTAHAHGVNGVNAALRAGVDSIEHGTYLDAESIRLFKRTGAYLVPTLLAGVTVSKWAADPDTFLTPPQRAKSAEVGPRMIDMARRAHEGGVKIAFGTDSGVSRHGDNGREFALLVQAGLTPMEAIRTATVAAAEHLGESDRLGSLAPGKFADIIAVNGDPRRDVRALEVVDFVMKEGVAYKTPHASDSRPQNGAAQSPKVTLDREGVMHVPAYRIPPSVYTSEEAQAHYKRLGQTQESMVNSLEAMVARAKAVYPVSIEETRIAGIRTDVILPSEGVAERNRDRILINLHGGGFQCFPLAQLLESIPIASTAKIKVISIDYRCAPEHQFPAGSEDVAAVYKELLKQYKPGNIGIYGCSAGGLLAMESMAWFQKENLPNPGAIGAFCAADHILGGDSRYNAASVGSQIPPPTPNPPLEPIESYFADVDVSDALVSPSLHLEVLAKFPPTLLITATRDSLLSSVVHAHRQLVKAGVDADLHVWDGLGHCFFLYVDLPESKDMYRLTAKFFDEHLGK